MKHEKHEPTDAADRDAVQRYLSRLSESGIPRGENLRRAERRSDRDRRRMLVFVENDRRSYQERRSQTDRRTDISAHIGIRWGN